MTQCHTQYESRPWMDTFAVSMSVLCAIHCMVTPILIALLPIVSSSFWVHKDFHLWMLLLVVPMAGLSLFLGCRKHKSKFVMVLGIIGVGLIGSVALYESFIHASAVLQEGVECAQCSQCESASLLNPITITNMLGAFFLVCAHSRNFILCRQKKCCH